MEFNHNILLVGNNGFLGFHLIYFFVKEYSMYNFIFIDKYTSIQSFKNLKDLEAKNNFTFINSDTFDYDFMVSLLIKYNIDHIIYLNPLVNIDRTINDLSTYKQKCTNEILSILLATRDTWKNSSPNNRIHFLLLNQFYEKQKMESETLVIEKTKDSLYDNYLKIMKHNYHFINTFYRMYNLPIIVLNGYYIDSSFKFLESLIPSIIESQVNKDNLTILEKRNLETWFYLELIVCVGDMLFHNGRIGCAYKMEKIIDFNYEEFLDIIKKIRKDSKIDISITKKLFNNQFILTSSINNQLNLSLNKCLNIFDSFKFTTDRYNTKDTLLENLKTEKSLNNLLIKEDKEAIRIIKGNLFIDNRGELKYFNELKFGRIKRFYLIQQSDNTIVRGWHGHKFEAKWFCCVKGSFVLSFIRPDNWEEPSFDLKPQIFYLYERNSEVIYLPNGYANCIRALEKDSILLVYSEKEIEVAKKDSWRWPSEMWGGNKI